MLTRAMRAQYAEPVFRAVRWTEWSEAHVAEHNIRVHVVEEVLFDPPRWITSGRGGTALVYGATEAGRDLLVVVVEGDGDVFVVTARDMHRSEKRTFERRAQ